MSDAADLQMEDPVDNREFSIDNSPCSHLDGLADNCQPATMYVNAEGDTSAASTYQTAVGEFTNLAENNDGTWMLERRAPTVSAVFSTSRSPVQYFARQHPETLFTIPAKFRPALDIRWEVEGMNVDKDGLADPVNPSARSFTLRVLTDGSVYYVDNEQVEGVGHLRYTTRLAGPAADAKPNVCNRTIDLKQALVEILTIEDKNPPDCADITHGSSWPQLKI